MKTTIKGFSFKKKKKILEMATNTSMAEVLLMGKIVEGLLVEHDIFYLNNHPEIVWDKFVKIRDNLIKELNLVKSKKVN